MLTDRVEAETQVDKSICVIQTVSNTMALII